LQNKDPLKIKYELHDDNKWLPYVRDSDYPHKWDGEEDTKKFKLWLKFVAGEKVNPAEEDEGPNRLKLDLTTLDFLMKGEFM